MLPAIAARRKAEQGCQPGNRWPATFYQSGSGLGGPTGHAKAPEIRSSGLLRPEPLFVTTVKEVFHAPLNQERLELRASPNLGVM